jgi:hypothetical protein
VKTLYCRKILSRVIGYWRLLVNFHLEQSTAVPPLHVRVCTSSRNLQIFPGDFRFSWGRKLNRPLEVVEISPGKVEKMGSPAVPTSGGSFKSDRSCR